ncbi:MAG: hypothetical protein ACKV2T_02660 [Kofleriaceae bacterium]
MRNQPTNRVIAIGWLLALGHATGCVLVDEGGGGGGGGGGSFRVSSTFDVRSGFTNFVDQPGDEVKVYARLSGSGTVVSDTFSPDDDEISLSGLEEGTHEFWVEYVSFRGVVVDSTPVRTIDVDRDLAIDTVLTLNKGFWQFNIALEDANGATKTCADFPAAMNLKLEYSVRDTIPSVTPDMTVSDTWTCAEAQSLVYTSPMSLAYYEIQLKLVDSSGRALAQSDRYGANVLGGNDSTNLGYYGSPTVQLTAL